MAPSPVKRTTGVTIGQAQGAEFGALPIGPLSPGYNPLLGTIEGAFINLLQRFNWRSEITFHRPVGKLPNLAPPNLAFVGQAIPTVPARGSLRPRVLASAPNFGPFWNGTGG